MHQKKIIIALISFLASQLPAQKIGDHVKITCRDQSIVHGKLITQNSDHWVIKLSTAEKVTISKQNVVNVVEVNALPLSSYQNLAHAPYWLAQTAIALKPGEGYYQNSDLLFQSAQCGLSKHVSATIGVQLLLEQDKLIARFSYMLFRYHYSVHPLIHFSAGMYLGVRSEQLFLSQNNDFAVPQGTMTFGNRDNNISFTYAYRLQKTDRFNNNLSDPKMVSHHETYWNVGGKLRLHEKWFLVGEYWNFGWNEALSLWIVGTRYQARRFNIGVGGGRVSDEATPIPMLTIGVPMSLF